MHHVEYEECYITLLNEEEILNPFLVLDEMFAGIASAESLSDELYEIFNIGIRRNHWIKYESPFILYRKYKRLVRLIETGWVLAKIRPDNSTHEKFLIPYDKALKSFPSRISPDKRVDPNGDPYKILVEVYINGTMDLMIGTLYELLYYGLDPSCARIPLNFESYHVITVQNLNLLIHALFNIYSQEKETILQLDEIKTLSMELKTFKDRVYMYNYHDDITHVFRSSPKKKLLDAINISKHVLGTNGFWKLYGNPANMLHYYHDFLFLLDYFAEHYQEAIYAGADITAPWNYPSEKHLNKIRSSYKWSKRPWKYLDDRFKEKNIAEWRKHLESCLEDVLSNKSIFTSFDRDYTSLFDFLTMLVEFVEIRQYEPAIE
ncbi:hypothetical protein PQ465_04245 [Sphingobacterium oryzagri]|uniref:Uncharacterized protein n=1 Tax=Sphingobacterium oryzagri TaxID=3025669 RepID=A0ABY7WK92_9SPHI|nr:hypothetical protein [Sphingobacterium sp. KACC 22765]WDF69593.1 hypothetical protein PQ465_04245 [Sphingobacterium sp. KACC 22765]